jgi:nitrite reductase/ring-hydroxylating ferredoxin subunit
VKRVVGTIAASSLGENAMRKIDFPPYHILVARVNGQLFAIEDSCPHSGWSLCEGAIENGRVICPGHGWEIDLATGEVVTAVGEGERALRYDVREEEGAIVVRSLGVEEDAV